MLNRYTGQNLYPGFESLPHRQLRFTSQAVRPVFRRAAAGAAAGTNPPGSPSTLRDQGSGIGDQHGLAILTVAANSFTPIARMTFPRATWIETPS